MTYFCSVEIIYLFKGIFLNINLRYDRCFLQKDKLLQLKTLS
jgi:hypothetical protein